MTIHTSGFLMEGLAHVTVSMGLDSIWEVTVELWSTEESTFYS